MTHTTNRLAIPVADGTDTVTGYPATVDQPAKAILDGAATYEEGTLALRPAAGTIEHGRFYKTTDAGKESLAWHDGSSWLPVGLIPQTTTTSLTAVSGQMIVVTGGTTPSITLPSHASGQIIGVSNRAPGGCGVFGTAIYGAGLSNAATFELIPVGSCAILVDDGTAWNIVSGQQDTGWTALSLATHVANIGGGEYAASSRVVGVNVELSGALGVTSNVSGGSTLFTVPANAFPASIVTLSPTVYNTSTWALVPGLVQISTSGVATWDSPNTLTSGIVTVPLDGLSFRPS